MTLNQENIMRNSKVNTQDAGTKVASIIGDEEQTEANIDFDQYNSPKPHQIALDNRTEV